jgi:hypothetical protein
MTGVQSTRQLVSIAVSETMPRYDSEVQKSFAQIRVGIDRSILLHSWAHINVCPRCGCESEILFGDQTPTDENYVGIEDCELCNAVLQEMAGHIDEL